MSDLILYERWTTLTADQLRRYCGITGTVCGPDEKVIARAWDRGNVQVFIVSKDWYDGGPLGQTHAVGTAKPDLLEALRSAQNAYHSYMVNTGRWPETRNTGTILDRKYWPKEAQDGHR